VSELAIEAAPSAVIDAAVQEQQIQNETVSEPEMPVAIQTQQSPDTSALALISFTTEHVVHVCSPMLCVQFLDANHP